MSPEDRNETRQMIVDVLAPMVERIEGRDILMNKQIESRDTLMNVTLNNMDGKLGKIDVHLEKLNGKVAEHEKILNSHSLSDMDEMMEDHDKIISKNIPHSILHCAQATTIKGLHDNMITNIEFKRRVIAILATIATLTTMIWISIQIIKSVG